MSRHLQLQWWQPLVEFSFFLPLQGALSDSEEESASADLKDLEFKLLHDLTQLQVRRVRSVLGRQV